MTEISNNLELPNVLDDVIGARAGEINCAVVCKVEDWSRTAQTATVAPQVRRDGETLPAIPDVPVMFPVAYQDVQTGTYGILICSRDNWRRWWRTGELSNPEDEARHELTNGIFIPGLATQTGTRTLGADSAVLLRPTGLPSTVCLGTAIANKAAVHEDLLSDLSTFLTALTAWGAAAHANWAAASVAWAAIGGPGPTATQLINQIAAGAYQSPSVMVED